MPPSNLLKYARTVKRSEGQQVFWSRADRDGLPFRGPQAPQFTEDEFEANVVRVADFRDAFFDVADDTQNDNFRRVMECVANGWFRLVFIERFWQGTTKHYVEWVEFWLEDGRRVAYTPQSSMEVAGGDQSQLPVPVVQHPQTG